MFFKLGALRNLVIFSRNSNNVHPVLGACTIIKKDKGFSMTITKFLRVSLLFLMEHLIYISNA